MKRRYRRLFNVIFISLAILIIPLAGLLYTEKGLNLVFDIATRTIPGELSVNTLQGRLGDTISFENLSYKNETTEVHLRQGYLQWQPEKLLSGLLDVNQLTVDGIKIKTFPAAQATKPQPEQAFELPQIKLPLRLSIENVALNEISLESDNTEVLLVNTVKLNVSTQQRFFKFSELFLDTPDYSISLNGKIKPLENYPMELFTTFKTKELLPQPLLIDAEIKGDLQQLNATADAQGLIDANVNGEVLDIINNLNWKAKADLYQLSLNSFGENLPAINIVGGFTTQGDLEKFSVIGDASTFYDEIGDLTSDFNLTVAGNELIINDFAFAEKNSSASLQSQGSVSWGGEDVVYDLVTHWQQVQWPIKQTAQIQSDAGMLAFKGTVSDYTVNAEAAFEIRDYPAMQIAANASGDLQHLNVNRLELAALQGQVSGSGMVRWQDVLTWQADLLMQQLNPRVIAVDWPGNINGRLVSQGKLLEQGLSAQAALIDLNGSLQGQPLSGTADAELQNNNVTIKTAKLNINGNKLSVNGKVADSWDIKYEIQLSNLAALQPEAGGEFQAQGRILGPREMPQVILDFTGENLKYAEYALAALNGKINVSLQPEDMSTIRLNVKGLQMGENLVDSINLTGDGTIAQHRISLNINQKENSASWQVSGSLLDNRWQGRLVNSVLKVAEQGEWRLAKKSEIVLAKDKVVVESNCYVLQQSSVCFQAQYEPSNANASFEWNKLSTENFNIFLPPGINTNTELNGRAKIKYKAEEVFISAFTKNSPGRVNIVVDDVGYSFPFQAGETRLVWNSQEINFTVFLPLEDDAEINAQMIIEQTNKDLSLLQQPVSGKLTLDTNSLIILAPFAPGIKDLEKASANAKLQLNGSLSQPELEGFLDVNAKQLSIPALNVTLEDVNLRANADSQQHVEFSAKAESGPGRIQIKGETQFEPGETFSLHTLIEGERFVVIDLPEATVEVNPKIIVQVQQKRVSIEGDLLIPYARLRPKTLPTGAASESEDVVIVGEEPEEEAEGQWQVSTRVRVILGDRVSFEGFGLRAKLRGSLQVVDRPGEVTVGRGEINLVDGFYSAYGQELQISRGRFIFANTPIDNPGLDIRAQRTVGDVIAGVKVSSTLHNPEVRLFSEPTMSETDTLSYLLLGRPLQQVNQTEGSGLMTAATAMGLAGGELIARNIGNRLGIEEIAIETSSETGASSLVVGRYLSPRLYIRYLTGIFERSNIVQLRYDVSKKVTVQTETGSEMGADIFYKIEH